MSLPLCSNVLKMVMMRDEVQAMINVGHQSGRGPRGWRELGMFPSLMPDLKTVIMLTAHEIIMIMFR